MEVGGSNIVHRDRHPGIDKVKPKPVPHTKRNNNNKVPQLIKNKKLIILADSQGKHINTLIENHTGLNVCSFVRTGAQFDKVTEELRALTRDLNQDDYVLVFGGTNNIEKTGIKRLLDGIKKVITDCKHTNLLLATIPMRHDNPKFDPR